MKDIKNLIFDMDDTLYPASLGQNDKIKVKQKQFFENSKYTVQDFMTHGFDVFRKDKDFDWDRCSRFICDVDISAIKPVPELDKILKNINQKKIVFTNSHPEKMDKILNQMELSNSFDLKICPHDLDFYFKPELKCFENMFAKANIDANSCMFFEDNLDNLKVGKKLGMTTVYIFENQIEKPAFCDYVFPNIVTALKSISTHLK